MSRRICWRTLNLGRGVVCCLIASILSIARSGIVATALGVSCALTPSGSGLVGLDPMCGG